jgi:hypothetical protein
VVSCTEVDVELPCDVMVKADWETLAPREFRVTVVAGDVTDIYDASPAIDAVTKQVP